MTLPAPSGGSLIVRGRFKDFWISLIGNARRAKERGKNPKGKEDQRGRNRPKLDKSREGPCS